MRRFTYIYILLISVLASCNSNKTRSISNEKDSLSQVIDSFSNIDVQLSFKGLTLGTPFIESDKKGYYGDGLLLSKINECSFQGTTSISYIDDDGNEKTDYPQAQVDVVDGLIAKISILSKSWNVWKFYIDTYNSRYYESKPSESKNGGADQQCYSWHFKGQRIYIRRLYHTDSELGVYRITDAVLIEYEHDTLCEKLEQILSSLDSLKEENIKKRTEDLRNNI